MNERTPSGLAAWFDLRRPLPRSRYAAAGFGLMLLKYALDALALRTLAGVSWTPLDYFSPLSAPRLEKLREHDGIVWMLVLWTLPFIWVGVTLTFRRALDAALSPWIALLFFVPLLNYALMLGLCIVPSRSAAPRAAAAREVDGEGVAITLRAVLAGLLAGVPAFAVSVYVARDYGWALFAGTPLFAGCVAAFVYRRQGGSARGAIWRAPPLTVLVAVGLCLLFALEGVICLAMILPLAVPLAVLGGLLGNRIGELGARPFAAGAIALVGLPGLAGVESALERPARFEVRTALEIDAPPERVWQHVIAFGELPPPTELLFRAGIAAPTRARIEGHGVGAVRHCEFTTGTFVEPITAWDEPTRLAFDVTEQPDPLRELHPWAHLRPPHLEHGWRSLRGEFLLEPLPGGRTRLVGTTWCELAYAPTLYWRPQAEGIVHAIHGRVLRHIEALALR